MPHILLISVDIRQSRFDLDSKEALVLKGILSTRNEGLIPKATLVKFTATNSNESLVIFVNFSRKIFLMADVDTDIIQAYQIQIVQLKPIISNN